MFAGHHDLAAGDDLVIGEDPCVIFHTRVELDNRAAAHLQKLMDRHLRTAEHDRNLHIDLANSDFERLDATNLRCVCFCITHDAINAASGLAVRKRSDTFTMEWRVSQKPEAYPDALSWMERRVAAIRDDGADECIWLLEHPPLYTAGTSAQTEDLLQPDRFPVHRTGRGGEYTYHGPGQRIAYAMLDLKARRPDVRWFVNAMEEWIILSLKSFGVRGERREGRVGVWVVTSEGEKKIAALGVRVRKWVTFHGLSINVDPDLSHFDGIVPCGIQEFGVTSLADLGVAATMDDLDAALRDTFDRAFS